MSHELKSSPEAPNYTLRRALAAGAISVVALSITEVITDGGLSQTADRAWDKMRGSDLLDTYDCDINSGHMTTLSPGETIWDEGARYLAAELNIPIDTANNIIKEANPGSDVGTTTTYVIPNCEN